MSILNQGRAWLHPVVDLVGSAESTLPIEVHRASGVLAAVTPSPPIASLASSEPVVNLKRVGMTPVFGRKWDQTPRGRAFNKGSIGVVAMSVSGTHP